MSFFFSSIASVRHSKRHSAGSDSVTIEGTPYTSLFDDRHPQHLSRRGATHSNRLRSTWQDRRTDAVPPRNATISMPMSSSYSPVLSPKHSARAQSPLRSKASVARLFGMKRPPSDESADTSTVDPGSHKQANSGAIKTASPAPPMVLMSTKSSATATMQSRAPPGDTNSDGDRRSSMSSELWGTPVNDEAIAMGLVSADRESRAPISRGVLDGDRMHPSRKTNSYGHHQISASRTAVAPQTQLKQPTSKALKKIFKSSAGLKKIMAEQDNHQQDELLKDHTQSQTKQRDDCSGHFAKSESYNSLPFSAAHSRAATSAHSSGGSFGRNEYFCSAQYEHPYSSYDDLDQIHCFTPEHSPMLLNHTPLKAVGLGEELAEKEKHEEAAFMSERVSQGMGSYLLQRSAPRVYFSNGHTDGPMSSSSTRLDETESPQLCIHRLQGHQATSSVGSNASDALPGWDGYAHYLRNSDELGEWYPVHLGDNQLGLSHDLESLALGVRRGSDSDDQVDNVNVLTRNSSESYHDAPTNAFWASSHLSTQPSEGHSSACAIASTSTKSGHRCDATEGAHDATRPDLAEGTRRLGEETGVQYGIADSHGSPTRNLRLLRRGCHSSISEWTVAAPTTPPKTALPSIPVDAHISHKDLVQQTPPGVSCPSTTAPSPSVTSSVSPSSPSFPHTPVSSRDASPSMARDVLPSDVQHSIDSSMMMTKKDKKHRKSGMKKAPSMGSLSLASTWPNPPKRGSSVNATLYGDGLQESRRPGWDACVSRRGATEGSGRSMRTVLPTCEEESQGENSSGRAMTSGSVLEESRSNACMKYAMDHRALGDRHYTHVQDQQKGHGGSSAKHQVQHNRCASHTWDEETEKIVTQFLLLSSRKRSGSSLSPLSEE
ncbi:unnamed protein product [Sympodiomycopsis kandeliae]